MKNNRLKANSSFRTLPFGQRPEFQEPPVRRAVEESEGGIRLASDPDTGPECRAPGGGPGSLSSVFGKL